MSMAEYEITLTGDDIPAQLDKLCAVEPGVYGKRWNPDGSLTVMVRAVTDGHERQANELIDALEQAGHPIAAPAPDEGPRRRSARYLDKNPDEAVSPKSDRDLDSNPDTEAEA